ncbi:hypothetical protein [Anabaena azotica]|uniref:Uncharacterized protein n=1 Tax=Anabaena azotica FACHB-119 TaxID=947527 RepID=A0ABR8DBE0_9NOST|nr:hypothetical protein [Anabaena azotica]MBD2503944.1 hypothetical protein [Anabaena azotica FACHB-119]
MEMQDFSFLNPEVALKLNPIEEGQYIVLQSYPLNKYPSYWYLTFNFFEAEEKCSAYNAVNEYSSCVVRLYHKGKLWVPSYADGSPFKISEQQFWKLHPSYENQFSDLYGRIEICICSYLYFVGKTDIETCLEDDFGRIITSCPNCELSFYEDEDDMPEACRGCLNYDGGFYGDNQRICAMHPYGVDNDICPDFRSE